MQENVAVLSEEQQEVLETLRGLDEVERQAARDRAKENLLARRGGWPKFEDFAKKVVHKYPAWFTRMVVILVILVTLSAAAVSIFRVFTRGRDGFMETISGEPGQAMIVGLAMFIMAEFMVVVAILAVRVFFKGRAKWLMAIPIILGILVALIGNWSITNTAYTLEPGVSEMTSVLMSSTEPSHSIVDNIWILLETVVPPVTVLFMMIILESLFTDWLGSHHEQTRLHNMRQAEIQALMNNPQADPEWPVLEGHAFKEAIVAANSRGTGSKKRREVMAWMTGPLWSLVVWREKEADRWLDSTSPFAGMTVPAGTSSANPTSAAVAQVAPPEVVMANPNGQQS